MKHLYFIPIAMILSFLCGSQAEAEGNDYSLLDHCPNQEQKHVFDLMKPVTNISIIRVMSDDIKTHLTELHSSNVFELKTNIVERIINNDSEIDKLVGYIIRQEDERYSSFLSNYNARYNLQSSPEFMAVLVMRGENYGYYESNVERIKCSAIPVLLEGQKYIVAWDGKSVVSVEPFKSDDSYWFGFISSLLGSNFFSEKR